jgi:ribosomal protein S27AE
MKRKVCSQCKKEKEIIQFNKRHLSKDGLNAHCISCHRKYDRKRYELNKEKRKKLVRLYNKKNKEKISLRRKEKYKQKDWAREKVRRALKNKLLTKKSCKKCGEWEVQAHHKDYSKPLDVVWLCRKCHGMEHRKK